MYNITLISIFKAYFNVNNLLGGIIGLIGIIVVVVGVVVVAII